MGRLNTVGFELKQGASEQSAEGVNWFQGTPTFSATAKNGSWALRCLGAQCATVLLSAVQASGRTYYLKFHYQIHVFPSGGDSFVAGFMDSSTNNHLSLVIDSTGHLYLATENGTHIGSGSPALSLDTWYCVEMKYIYTGGAVEARLDGTAFGSGTATASGASYWAWVGDPANALSQDQLFDNLIVNDDQGSYENGYPGAQLLAFLWPVSDNNRGGWVAGGGGTANLYDAINNAPPVGASTETNTSAIKNTVSSASDNADFNMTDYLTAGIGAGDTITVIQALIRHGEHAATGTKSGAIKIVSNPTQTGEDTFTYGNNTGANGAEIGHWWTKYGAPQYSPSVTKGTQPVARAGKRTATTSQVCVDALGMLVSYTVSADQDISGAGAIASAQTLGSPTLDQSISPSAISTSEGFGTPYVALNVFVTGAGTIASGEALGSPALEQSVTVSGITGSAALGTPSVSLEGGDLAVTGAGAIASSEVIGQPTLESNISVTGIGAAEAFGAVTFSQNISSAGAIVTAETLGSPTATQNVTPSGLISSEVLGVLTLALNITVSGIASSVAVGVPVFVQNIMASGIATSEAIGSPVTSVEAGEQTVAGAGAIASAETFGTTSLTLSIAVSGIASPEALGNPTVALDLSISLWGIAGQEAFGAPSFSLELSLGGIAGCEEFGLLFLRHEATPGIARLENLKVTSSRLAALAVERAQLDSVTVEHSLLRGFNLIAESELMGLRIGQSDLEQLTIVS